MPRVHYVKRARKDNPAVKKGQPYYWWQFYKGPKRYSETPPTRSQLTRSEYYLNIYAAFDGFDPHWEEPGALDLSIEDSRDQWVAAVIDNFDAAKEELRCLIEEIREDCEEKLSNMESYNITGGFSYELLEERRDEMDTLISNIEGVDIMAPDTSSEEGFYDEVQEAFNTAVEEIRELDRI